jgi:hypothetical protein
MRRLLLPLLAFGAAALAPASAARADEVAVFRIADEGSLRVSAARASRGSGAAATVVVVLETGRGDRLFLRRAPGEGGTTVYDAWLGGPPGLTFTRRGDTFLLQAGGRSLSVVEADLPRPTVRCWVSTLIARADPKFLAAASGVRVLKDATGGPAPDDVFTPMRLLWQVADPSDVQPRGAVKLEKGPFTGETWDRLRAAAQGELGRR